MNTKEIGEIRRRQRRDRSNMTKIFGCYVNDKKEIISEFARSTGMMSENEAEKYFALLRRTLGGTLGKNLLDITFRTSQVADSPEHKLLMSLRGQGIHQDEVRMSFYKQVMENLTMEGNYLILLGTDSYDVPFKSKDGDTFSDNSDEIYTYVLCAVCPVKQTKAVLHYEPSSKEFQDGNMVNAVAAPELGFLFPAFDGRATNIYNALYFNRSPKDNHEGFVAALFNTPVAKPAQEQKECFEDMLSSALNEECSLEVVQTVHDQLCQQLALHKESKLPEALTISKEQVTDMLESCGVSEERIAKFSVDFEEVFGLDAEVYPSNIIDTKKIEIKTDDVSIKVATDRSDLIQTRVIGGVKYILIRADENVEVNGVNIHIADAEPATV
ncbi:MAG: DUF4317 domain-containing protein [Oscillospiraceae bacterium]|nr:DUF4317 domain-containing protein [Oscillospiraceae bacterium]